MKLTVHTFVSLDGVMQGPGGPEEDTSGGFERGGWMVPYGDAEFGAIVDDWFSRTGELLLGRTTYDIFAAYWPHVTDPAERVAAVLNTAPKHVVSNSLTDPTWDGTTVISGTPGEVVAAIRALKDRPATTRDDSDGELQVHGSCGLIRTLHDARLVDEYHLTLLPVVVGQGRRLFPDGALPTSFEVAHAATTSTGLVALTLRPTGRLAQGTHEVRDGRDTPIT